MPPTPLARRAGEAATLWVALSAALGGHADQHPVILTATSTTPRRRPPPNCCKAHPAPRSAPAASTSPTTATRCACSTSPRSCPRAASTPASTKAAPELIGHILVSKTLVTPLSAVTAQAVIDAPLASINPTDPTARRNTPASDHAPVTATFTNL
jgi:hypothetical protein